MSWLLQTFGTDGVEQLGQAMTLMLRRPYFQRAWILQEVFTRQHRVQICCGSDTACLAKLFAIAQAFRQVAAKSDFTYEIDVPKAVVAFLCRDRHLPVTAQYLSYDHPTRAANFMLDVSFPGRRASNQESGYITANGRDGLQEVLAMTCEMQCHDPRDRIYSTIAMVDWQTADPITPDYSRTRLGVALDVLRRDSTMGVQWHRHGLRALTDALELTEDEVADIVTDHLADSSFLHEVSWSQCSIDRVGQYGYTHNPTYFRKGALPCGIDTKRWDEFAAFSFELSPEVATDLMKGFWPGLYSRPRGIMNWRSDLVTALYQFRGHGSSDLRTHLHGLWDVIEGGSRILTDFPTMPCKAILAIVSDVAVDVNTNIRVRPEIYSRLS